MTKGTLIDFQEELEGIKGEIRQLRRRSEDDMPGWADEVSAAIEEVLEIEIEVHAKCRRRLGLIRKWMARTHFTNGKEGQRLVERAYSEMGGILNDYFEQ